MVNYSGQFTYDAVGRLKFGGNGADGFSSLTYDGENRLVAGDTFGASSAEDYDCHSGGAVASWAPPAMEQSYMYDGLGQMFQDRQPNTTFNNRVVTHIRQWMWNGSGALFTLSAPATWNGAIGGPTSYSADGLGSMAVANMALTLSDRNVDGAVAQYHNNTGHSSWNATNSYNQFCISANPLPASPAYSGPDNAVVPDDGSSDQSLVVSSYGRAFLSRSMGYTTPDYGSATPYSGGHPRGLLGRTDDTDGCPIGLGYAEVNGVPTCLPFIGPPVEARPPLPPPPWDCAASSSQCGFLDTSDDPFGFRVFFPRGGWPPPVPNIKLNYRKDDLRRNIIACAPASTVTEAKRYYVMGEGYAVFGRGWNIGVKHAELVPQIEVSPTQQLSWYFQAPVGEIASGINLSYISKQLDGEFKIFAKCEGNRLSI